MTPLLNREKFFLVMGINLQIGNLLGNLMAMVEVERILLAKEI
jgi:hypothetical protein